MRKLKNEELHRLSPAEYKESPKMPVVVVLDNIRSLNNIGSIFRTADAFRVQQIHLCGITATPPHREIQKTALGATESVDWKYYTSTLDSIDELRKRKYRIIAIEQASDSILLHDFKAGKEDALALVFGHEVHGVDQNVVDACDQCVEIPQFGTKHSFNVSVSAGIVIWDIFIKINRL